MFELNWNGKTLTIEYVVQLDNYHDGAAFFAAAHDENGNKYEVRWDYTEPEWYVSEEDTPTNNDISDFADWDHPAEVIEL